MSTTPLFEITIRCVSLHNKPGLFLARWEFSGSFMLSDFCMSMLGRLKLMMSQGWDDEYHAKFFTRSHTFFLEASGSQWSIQSDNPPRFNLFMLFKHF